MHAFGEMEERFANLSKEPSQENIPLQFATICSLTGTWLPPGVTAQCCLLIGGMLNIGCSVTF